MHWRKQVTNCDLVLKINKLIQKFPKKNLVTQVTAFVFTLAIEQRTRGAENAWFPEQWRLR